MPGNELGDRVHNFFAEDNSLQGQNHSQVAEGNWPVLNSNFLAGSQRQADLLNSSNRNFNSQNSDLDRGEASYPFHVTHGLNFSQSNLRLDFAKSQPLNEQLHLNGFMYGNQFHQTRQNEANFLAVDTEPDQSHSITSRGLSVRELQQGNGPDYQAKAAFRTETSVSPVSFDLFGGQQQMSHQQSSIPQSLQRQHLGFNDMQHLQQQLVIRKMQELQRHQQLQQIDLRQQNLINQVPPFAKQAPGSQSTLVNGTPNSDTLQYPWTAEPGAKWLNRGSPTIQGSPSGLGFPPNHGQTQRLVDLVPQQVDQSLYGVPISSSRGLNQYSQMVADRYMPQTSSNFLQSSQQNLLPEQAGAQDDPSISRHKFQNENLFGLASRQPLNTDTRNVGGHQQVSFISRTAPQQDFLGRQELAVQQETSHEQPARQVVSPQNGAALDPTEEKILFGSDDNIWAAFGKAPNMSGEVGNSLDNDGLSNGFPSIKSGSWSALMQSAVAETSSGDMAPQEEWSNLMFHNNDGPSGSQPASMHNDCHRQETSLANDKIRMPSALSSGSFPPPDDPNTNYVMGSNLKFQNDPGQRPQTEMYQRFLQSSEGAGNWSNSGPLQKSVAQGSQIYRDVSQHPLQSERNARMNSPPWVPGQIGTRLQSNGGNAQAAISPGGDRVMNIHEAEKSQQHFQNSQVRMLQGEVVHGSSLWKSNSIPSSATELGHVKSRVGNLQAHQGVLSLNDTASVAKSCNVGISDETSPFLQNNYLLNQWKDAQPPARSQGRESVGRPLNQANESNHVSDSMNSCGKEEVSRHGMENCDGKENSNDSHRSNLSQHTSSAFREGGLSDASDSRSLPTGNQKSMNQLSRKISASRKFQYHPMGNVTEDVEPPYGLKQPTHVPDMPQQNVHFVQAKVFGHVPRNSTIMEKGQASEPQRDSKGSTEESPGGSFSGHAANTSIPFGRPIDTYTSSSQNMLELLHKVDQSRNHGAKMQLSSSECNASSQQPEAENFDGVGRLQHNQSSVSPGFGLQLGPPSQRSRFPDHPSSSQNIQGAFNSSDASNTAVEMGDKSHQLVASNSVQSLSSIEATEAKSKLNRSAILGNGNGNSLYKTPGNFSSAFSSGIPYSRINVQNQQMTSGQMSMNQNVSLLTGNVSQSAHGSVETLSPDASRSFHQDNLASPGGVSQQNGLNDVQERVPTATIPTSDSERLTQHFAMPGLSGQGGSLELLHNVRSNVPTHQHNIGFQFQQASSHIPESPQPNILESSFVPLAQGHIHSHGIVDGKEQGLKESSGQPVASVSTDTVPKTTKSLGKASSIKNRLDESPANSASTQKDIEAFGRSLKPNSFSHQNYFLQNQMQALKDADIDSSNGVSKRMKGPDNIADVHEAAVLKAGQQNEHNGVVGDSFGSGPGAPTEDSRMLSFSTPADILQRSALFQGNVASPDTLGLRRDVHRSNSSSDYMTPVGADHHQVSPQMAPSWFNQYGTSKNGQILHIYDAHKFSPLRPGESPFTLGKSCGGLDMNNAEDNRTAIDACNQNCTPSSVANEQFSSPQSSQPDVSGQHLVISNPKKRKTATSELNPWHKEILDDSQDLQTLSMAEADWSKATNCLTQKVEDDVELTEDGPPMLRSKRRLTLTTHLMQQLFRPAPASILSADASTGYEIVAYAISRIEMGDACSTVSRLSNFVVPCDCMDLPPAKGKSSGRNIGRRYAKATEELLGRARKLENDFLRLDKSSSILDLRVECQDLEKFSVINRFARFHGRGQTENAETAPTNATSNTQKPMPQKYVTAVPMPKSLPDRLMGEAGKLSKPSLWSRQYLLYCHYSYYQDHLDLFCISVFCCLLLMLAIAILLLFLG